jgi:arginine/lysine/ornithine decarboxylase
MKKIIFTFIAMLCTTTAFAHNEKSADVSNVKAYDMSISMSKLSDALNLTNDQKEAVENIHYVFNAEMSYAVQNGVNESDATIKRIIDTDVKRMSYVLNEEQMHKYLVMLNATIKNRGLIK